MSNHPNRSGKSPHRNPSKVEILALREAVGLSTAEAGMFVHASQLAWERWESGEDRMHPAIWELFTLKATHPIFFELWREIRTKPRQTLRSRLPEATFYRRASPRGPRSASQD